MGRAVERYRSGEQWWLTEDEDALAQEQQSARMQTDPWHETIADYVVPGHEYTSSQLLLNAIKMPLERHSQMFKDRIATIMSDLDWAQKYAKQRQQDGSRTSIRVWRKEQ